MINDSDRRLDAGLYLILATRSVLTPTPTESFIFYGYLNIFLSCFQQFIFVWDVFR